MPWSKQAYWLAGSISATHRIFDWEIHKYKTLTGVIINLYSEERLHYDSYPE